MPARDMQGRLLGQEDWCREVERCASTYTYALWDGVALKIGRTRGSPGGRVEGLQTGNPRRLRLLGWSVRYPERTMHRRLRSMQLMGEWYRLGATVLVQVARWEWVDVGLFARLWQDHGGPLVPAWCY